MTPPKFPQQIAKLIPRLGSTFDGEVVATARAIAKALNGAGLDWFDLVDALTPARTHSPTLAKQDWSEKAGFCVCHGNLRLTDAEHKFVVDMTRMTSGQSRRQPSEKQLAWLDAIYLKLRREAA